VGWIIPGLFMGGHFYRAPSGDVVPAVAGHEFDLVVSLYRRDGHGPAAGIADHVREVPDAALTLPPPRNHQPPGNHMRAAATRFTVNFSGCEGFYRSSVENLSEPENPSAKPRHQLTPARQDPSN
jgi:hypothetical protein